jgi:hypothetical protein
MTYQTKYGIAIAVAVIAAMLGAATVAGTTLQLTAQNLAAIGIVQAGLTVLASFLPRVTAPPNDDRKGLD